MSSKIDKNKIKEARKVILDLLGASDEVLNEAQEQNIRKQKKIKIVKEGENLKNDETNKTNNDKSVAIKSSSDNLKEKKNNSIKGVNTSADKGKDDFKISAVKKKKMKSTLENFLNLEEEKGEKKEEEEIKRKVVEVKNIKKEIKIEKKLEIKKGELCQISCKRKKKNTDFKNKSIERENKSFKLPELKISIPEEKVVKKQKKHFIKHDFKKKEEVTLFSIPLLENNTKKVNRRVRNISKNKARKKDCHRALVNFSNLRKTLLSMCASTVLLAICFYFLLVVLVVTIEPRNSQIKLLSKYFFIPALITGSGVVEYENYMFYRDKLLLSSTMNIDSINNNTKIELIRMIIKDNLCKKYKTIPSNLENEILNDYSVNQVAKSRIEKIGKMVNEDSSNFLEISRKYADNHGEISFKIDNIFEKVFYQEVKDLALNGISDVVIFKNNYYIFRLKNRDNKNLHFDYALIKPVNLNSYIDQIAVNFKIWSFVK